VRNGSLLVNVYVKIKVQKMFTERLLEMFGVRRTAFNCFLGVALYFKRIDNLDFLTPPLSRTANINNIVVNDTVYGNHGQR